MSAYVCTRDRLLRLCREDGAWAAETVLAGERLQCVAARGDTVLAGTLGDGARLSRDGGTTWGLAMASHNTPDIRCVLQSL